MHEPDQAQAGCVWRMLRSADHTALLHLKPAKPHTDG